MIVNLSKVHCVLNGREYHLLCPMDSPLSEVKEACLKLIQYLGQVEDTIKEQQKQVESTDAVIQEPI